MFHKSVYKPYFDCAIGHQDKKNGASFFLWKLLCKVNVIRKSNIIIHRIKEENHQTRVTN